MTAQVIQAVVPSLYTLDFFASQVPALTVPAVSGSGPSICDNSNVLIGTADNEIARDFHLVYRPNHTDGFQGITRFARQDMTTTTGSSQDSTSSTGVVDNEPFDLFPSQSKGQLEIYVVATWLLFLGYSLSTLWKNHKIAKEFSSRSGAIAEARKRADEDWSEWCTFEKQVRAELLAEAAADRSPEINQVGTGSETAKEPK